jgi:hypothetical protein
MKKLLLISAIAIFISNGAFAQELSKEDKKRLREELKIYQSDLAGYKAKKDDIQATLDSNETEIKRLKEQIKSQTDIRNQMDAYESEIKAVKAENENLKSFNEEKVEQKVQERLTATIDSIMKSNPQAFNGNGNTSGNPTSYEANPDGSDNGRASTDGAGNKTGGKTGSTSGKSGNTSGKGSNANGPGMKGSAGGSNPATGGSDNTTTNKGNGTGTGGTRKGTKGAGNNYSSKGANANTNADNESPMATNTPTEGTVYKIQLGLYKKFNINKYFEDLKYIGYEIVDGKNRYVIGYFNDEQTAQSFVKDVRKMGIKDAFVAKYVDGKRIYEKK